MRRGILAPPRTWRVHERDVLADQVEAKARELKANRVEFIQEAYPTKVELDLDG